MVGESTKFGWFLTLLQSTDDDDQLAVLLLCTFCSSFSSLGDMACRLRHLDSKSAISYGLTEKEAALRRILGGERHGWFWVAKRGKIAIFVGTILVSFLKFPN